jgi:flagella basal body P-ring formation protein FlgA
MISFLFQIALLQAVLTRCDVEALKSEIVKFLNQKFAYDKIEFVVEIKSDVRKLFNCDSCEFEIVQRNLTEPRLYQTFKVKLHTKDGLQKDFTIQAFIRTFEDVLIAKRDLKRGEIADEDMFIVEKVETTFLRDGFVKDKGEILGKRLKKFLKKGEMVFVSYFEELPSVVAGERVKILAIVGNVKVETDGIAKSSGKINDNVRVLNLSSGKVIYGKVIGRGVVAVEIEN